jgi:diguanylate cyclase (GGDEF)-like protein
MMYFKQKLSSFLLANLWVGSLRWFILITCIGFIILLGVLRAKTHAEFAFASLALLPVMLISWLGGRKYGFLLAIIAATMWLLADIKSEQPFSEIWIPWLNAITYLSIYMLVVFLVVLVSQQMQIVREQATHDALTGLINRRAFLEYGSQEEMRSKRYNHSLAVLFLDLDNFKSLNDTLGHAAGDNALKVTAKALKDSLRSTDQTARLGGDEFAAILQESDYESSIDIAHKVFLAVNQALQEFPPVKVSIGVAWFEKADRTFPHMLKLADELMYEVKANGKGNMLSKKYAAN